MHGPALDADYFDGHSPRAHRVALTLADGQLHIDGDGVQRQVPAAKLQWPERTRHGARLLHLPDGASLQCLDGAAWDAWAAAHGRRDPVTVRLQQRWRWVAASLVMLVLLLAGGYRWGLPWAAQGVVAVTPLAVDRAVGEAALASVDDGLLQPSEISQAEQRAIEAAFARAVATLPPDTVPMHQLVFRKSRIGPNAFALPGGTIVLTDDLVRLAPDHTMVVGVLGHELGHLRHRHGMRMLVQAGAVSAAASALFGDFSSMLAVVPAWLAQAAYSRDAEREADAESVRLLRASGQSPAVMARFFELLQHEREERQRKTPGAAQWSRMGVAIASHPADAERIAFFEQAAASPSGPQRP